METTCYFLNYRDLGKETMKASFRCFLLDVFVQSPTKNKIVLATSLPEQASKQNIQLLFSFHKV